jgi:hypothetical protein
MFQFSAIITEIADPVAQTTSEGRLSHFTRFNSHETVPQQEIAYNQ